jgi:hypothetical protein
VEPIHQREVPERTPAIEAALGEGCAQPVQLLGSPWRWKRGMAKVMAEIEVGVFDEHRMMEAEGDRCDAEPKRRQSVEPAGQVSADVADGDRDRRLAAILGRTQNRHGHAVHGLLRQFQGEKQVVQTAQTL